MDISLVFVLLVIFAPLGKCASDGVVNVPPSEYWDGSDGPWSSFAIQVGTPPQNLRVLPSTSSSSTWVVLPEGCISSDPAACPSSRGFIFYPNASSTWNSQGLFELPLYTESLLGYTGNANFGFDNLTLGWQGQGGPTLAEPQVVAGMATKDFYIGVLGLNARAVNFTDFNDPKKSLLGSLREEGKVKGSSFGYTAGAPYLPTKVFGSLTFGGYDASRFTPNNTTFTFGADITKDLLVGIRSINTTTSEATPLLPTPIDAFIDTTVPDIWLPVSACQQFEKTLGLALDSASQLYLVNDTLHSALVARNEVFRFRLGMGVEGGETVDVVVPYQAFDLEVTLPGTQNRTRYFPIRRALNDSMYTIGRAFFQEAYLFTDYDRGTFTISQASFPNTNVPSQLTPVFPSDNTTTATPTPKPNRHRLSPGVVAGIAIPTALLLTSLLAIALLLRRNRNKKTKGSEISTLHEEQPQGNRDKAELDAGADSMPCEVPGIADHELEAGGRDGLRRLRELEGGSELFELPGAAVQLPELGGRGVSVRPFSTTKSWTYDKANPT